jgi:ketosteroid isomerase-like protein
MGWADELYAKVDNKDAAGFAAAFTEDGVFKYGNLPEVQGRAAIEQFCAGFFAGIAGLAHTIKGEYRDGATRFLEFECTYTRLDGSKVTLPAVTRFFMDGELARHAQVFMDVSPLFAPAE